MNKANGEKLQSDYVLCSEQCNNASNLQVDDRANPSENDNECNDQFKVQFQIDEDNDEVVKNSLQYRSQNINDNHLTNAKQLKKRSRFRRLKKLVRFVTGKGRASDDSIESGFPTTLTSDELKEYNNTAPIQTKKINSDNSIQSGTTVASETEYHNGAVIQTESTLTASPHYVQHVEMEKKKLKYLLARRSCHLPGNNWYQDWLQFICNNHPLFALCLRHRDHPINLKNRISILIASISFGLIATNFVYLSFLVYEGEDFEEDVIRFNLEMKEGFIFEAVLTKGAVMLLIFNGILHVLFDICMWHLSAATCCYNLEHHKIIKRFGSYAVIAISAWSLSFASYMIILRLSHGVNEETDNDWMEMLTVETFFIVLGYVLQLSLVYFIMNPIIVTIMFSGVLGCIPPLGGRPRDIQRELESVIDERIKYYSNDGGGQEYLIV